jgi:N-carbamoylputrescine amidase
LHAKSYLPEQNNVFEQTWFHRGDFDYRLYEINQWKVGTVICSELWFMRHIQAYGDQGAHLIACPRAGARSSTARWLIAGQAAAIIAGAYCISSNRASEDFFGGVGWIISPEGDILAHTSKETPFVTMELDLSQPTEAKSTYPRYIPRSPSDIPEFTNIGS